jgi:hypothetical protein
MAQSQRQIQPIMDLENTRERGLISLLDQELFRQL